MRVSVTLSTMRPLIHDWNHIVAQQAEFSWFANDRSFFSRDLLGQVGRPRVSQGTVEFESSDIKLAEGFRWAKAQALAYVRDSPVIGPWYEAALPGRNAFCMRDVSHMSTGAQFLGLGPNARNMLHQFAQHISASKNMVHLVGDYGRRQACAGGLQER